MRTLFLLLAGFLRLIVFAAPCDAGTLRVPGVATLGIESLGTAGATLTGEVNPHGLATDAWFEWGTDPALASPTATAAVPVGDGVVPGAVGAALDSLTPGVTYYYRVVAASAAGTSRGAVDYFAPLPATNAAVVVNCADDPAAYVPGKISLREAVEIVAPGGTITFDIRLDGARIDLSIVGEANSTLRGEVFTMSAGSWVFGDYQLRDYGASALYTDKSLSIDASGLPGGITLAWAGGDASHARVLAVYGDLFMNRVTVTSGYAEAAAVADDPAQPYTLARGGGIAVWGTATLVDCVVSGNRTAGDTAPGRDRGAFGGGIYADTVNLTGCTVSGNSVSGFGAAGGGVYSVGGAKSSQESQLSRSAISGNRVTAQHAYGGGVYSDGGGPGKLMKLWISDCTIARNLVEDHPDLLENETFQYYYRGGGVYISNGYLDIASSTIVENAVTGAEKDFNGKPNLGGGAVAATVGNAHVVEDMNIRHSIIAGNTLQGAPSDVFTGSLLHFFSSGYNLFGAMDFFSMLVPVPSWECLSRRHYPKVGDLDGVALADVLDMAYVRVRPDIVSVGTDAGGPAVVWYPPRGVAVSRIPEEPYSVYNLYAGYDLLDVAVDDFPSLVLEKLRTEHAAALGADFGVGWDLTDVFWYEVPYLWPSHPLNAPWIAFWRDLDTAIGDRLGTVRLGDDFWGTFATGMFGDHLVMTVYEATNGTVPTSGTDQLGKPRFTDSLGAVGAVDVDLPGAVTLGSPSGAIPSSSPTYTWAPRDEAESYLLWVGTGTSTALSAWYSASAAGCASGQAICSVTPATTLPAGVWYFNVRARNQAGSGPWTAAKPFVIATAPTALTLVSPSGVTGTAAPTYRWNAQAGAESYLLWVGTGTSTALSAWYSASAAGCASGQAICSVTPATTLPAGAWYFNVRARNLAGTGPWTAAKGFVIATVPVALTLVSPTGATGTPTPTYTWNAQAGVDSYLLWVGTGASTTLSAWYTATAAGCPSGTGTCSATPASPLSAGVWYFNVKGKNAAGTGPWTTASRFSTP